MAAKTAYALRESVEEFSGGTVHLGDNETFDLAQALEQGNGVIETDDPKLIDALDKVPALKHTTAASEKSESSKKKEA